MKIYDFKHLFFVSIFLILCSVIVLSSKIFTWGGMINKYAEEENAIDPSQQKTYFHNPLYFKMNNGLKNLKLKALKLTMDDGTKTYNFDAPIGIAFSKIGQEMNFESESGLFFLEKNELILRDNAHLFDKWSTLKADYAHYYVAKNKLFAKGKVFSRKINETSGDKITIRSKEVTSWPVEKKAHYKGKVSGVIKRKRVYEGKTYFKGDELLNKNPNSLELNGNVYIKKQGVRAWSHRGEIFLENHNKKLKYYALYDDVKLKEKILREDGTHFFRRAYGEKLEGFGKQGIIILTGYPKVYQGNDVIKGNKILLRENNEVVEVDDANSNFILEKN